MKTWFSPTQLKSLPGMPTCQSSVNNKAKRENWKSRPRKGLGGGKEYSYRSLPEETRIALAAKELEEKNAANPSMAKKQVRQLNKGEVRLVVRELLLLHDRQQALITEGRRLLLAITEALSIDLATTKELL